MFLALRRVVVAISFFFATAILGIFIDAAVRPVYQVAVDNGVLNGPFGSPIERIVEVGYLSVGIMMVSIALWLLFAPVLRERLGRRQEQPPERRLQ